MPHSFMEYDDFIYQEMMSHPALFTHPDAKKIALIDHKKSGILSEIVKHTRITELWHITPELLTEEDPRIHQHHDHDKWLAELKPNSFDVIIISNSQHAETDYTSYFHALHADGILIQQSDSLFHLNSLKLASKALQHAGFSDTQILHFPQPSFPSGWRTAIMAAKQSVFKRLSEKSIFNKTFRTRYYNFDVHKAALVMPEFIREAFAI